MARSRWLVAGFVAALVGVVSMLAARNQPHAPANASVGVRPSASAPPATSAAPQPNGAEDFTFDCAGLPTSSATCSGASPLAAELVESSLWTRTGAPECAGSLKGDRADSAERALRGAQALAHTKLPPLERALLQNAALRLLACSANVDKEPQRKEIAQNAKRLVKAFALTATEIGALPSSATELAWLGSGSDWQVGNLRTHLHELADGNVSTIERAMRGPEFVAIYRLILLDDKSELHATDVPSKLFLRRPAAQAGNFLACIATLDPVSAHCGVAALRPVSDTLQRAALERWHGVPVCSQCHMHNRPNSPSFGPATGLGPETVTLDHAREAWAKVLTP